jgi:hypothetical protein
MEEAVALVKEETKRAKHPYASRIYTSHLGTHDILAIEEEFETFEEYERYWTEWNASPEAAVFMEKFIGLTERGFINEIWRLKE